MRKWHTLVCAGIGLAFLGRGIGHAPSAWSASATGGEFGVSDARGIEPNSVRFSAQQLSRDAPVVVLFGATTPNWHKARAAIRQAIAEGYKVSIVIIGPVDEPPSLEIYAKGHHVTNPINLDEISQAEITALVRDVWREYYAR